jgi:uracil-DNA glycosylase
MLDDLLADIAGCRLCRDQPAGGLARALPHEPRPVCIASATARIAICGQAPGVRVHASGVPFTDPSGDRLRHWLGLDARTFYDARRIAIIPMGFCFPGLDDKGADLPPRRECARTWHPALFSVLPQIEIVLAVGQYAQAFHLGPRRGTSLTATVADWRRISEADAQGRSVWPLPHPSWRNSGWLQRNPWFEDELLPALRAALLPYVEST